MQLIVFVFLLIGIIMVVYGIYDEKYQAIKDDVRVEYRFVPRSYYDEQLFDSQFKDKVSSIFNNDDEWYHRTNGRNMNIDRRKI